MSRQELNDKNLDDLRNAQKLLDRIVRRAEALESDTCECAKGGDEKMASANAHYADALAKAYTAQAALQAYKASGTFACNDDPDVTANFGGT